MQTTPTVRTDGMLVEDLDDGVVVYDIARNQAHALDPIATRVFRLADGTRTTAQLAEDAGLDGRTTAAALARLQEEGLLQEDPAVSRRSLLKRTAAVGAGGLALAPLIETVIIPAAAAHASTMNTPQTPPQTPPGPPLVLEQPPVVHTPPRHSVKKKKKKKKHLTHRGTRHKPRRPKRPPSFTGAKDQPASRSRTRHAIRD